MNNKGQVLVLFVLLVPVFLMLAAFIIDIGILYSEDRHIESTIKDSMKYGLNNINNIDVKDKMTDLLVKNIKDPLNINVNIEDGIIYIDVEKKYNGTFKLLFDNNIYVINNSYFGYIDDNGFVINKE